MLPPNHLNIVTTLSNLGEIHCQRSEWDEATKMYGNCLDMLSEKYDKKDHADVALTLSTIGLIHDQRGDTGLSLHYLQDALLMRRRLLGNYHLDDSATLEYIGTILYRKKSSPWQSYCSSNHSEFERPYRAMIIVMSPLFCITLY